MNARLMPDALPVGATCLYVGPTYPALHGSMVKVTFVTQAQRYNADVLNADGSPVTDAAGSTMVLRGVHHDSLVRVLDTPPVDAPQIIAALPESAPVVVVESDSFDFVQDFLVPTADARKARKARNQRISKTLQSVDLPIGGPCWSKAQELADAQGDLTPEALTALALMLV